MFAAATGARHAFVINGVVAGVIAVAALAILLIGAQLLIVTQPAAATAVKKRRRGVKALVIGTDGRASTSKLQALLWTFAVLFAFIFLLAWGRSLGCGDAAVREGR